MYDFVAGKTDWFACGHPRERSAAAVPWVGDLLLEGVVTCRIGSRLEEVSELASGSELDFCVVVNEERVVAGVLRGNALSKDPGSRVEDVMELGPRTVRPSQPVEKLLATQTREPSPSYRL